MIPFELTEIPRWITWEHPGKQPLNSRGQRASALDPKNWKKFENVKENANIGFVLMGDFVVLDADHQPYIDLVTDKFSDTTYTEVSPNGGIHVWFRGSHRNLKGNFEVYGSKRYMTVTGAGNNVDITDLDDETRTWIDRRIKPGSTIKTDLHSTKNKVA
jgi:primase-polymerase (primpol)-like protein